MIKLTILVLSLLIMGGTLLVAKIRNASNKLSGARLIKAFKEGKADIPAFKAELIWTIAKTPLQNIDAPLLMQIGEWQEIKSHLGSFYIEHHQVLSPTEVLVAAFGHQNQSVGGYTQVFTYEKKSVDYAKVEIHFFLINLRSDTQELEVRSSIYSNLEEKSFKREFAEAVLKRLSKGVAV